MTRRASLALLALVGIVGITAAWWTLALWPPSAAVPAWVERTRAVCFGVTSDGLPSAAGWLSLVGEPLGMLGFLVVVWGDALREGLGALRRSRIGRLALGSAGALLLVGFGTATARVRGAGERFDAAGGAEAPRRLDRAPPPLALVDQRGDTVRIEQFRGRPVIVAFAYGHCETMCPAIVRESVRAAAETRSLRPALLVVTLDPWRDTPLRLQSIAAGWQLPADARVLGGDVALVERTLDAWEVVRGRDETTGEVTHQPLVYLLDRAGRVGYVLRGAAPALAGLIAAL